MSHIDWNIIPNNTGVPHEERLDLVHELEQERDAARADRDRFEAELAAAVEHHKHHLDTLSAAFGDWPQGEWPILDGWVKAIQAMRIDRDRLAFQEPWLVNATKDALDQRDRLAAEVERLRACMGTAARHLDEGGPWSPLTVRDYLRGAVMSSIDLAALAPKPAASGEGVKDRLAAAEVQRKERIEWVKLGAVQEDADLLDIFKAPAPSGIDCNSACRGKLTRFFEARIKASGATVRACTAEDMEPQPEPTAGRRPQVGDAVVVKHDLDAWGLAVVTGHYSDWLCRYERDKVWVGSFAIADEGKTWRWPATS